MAHRAHSSGQALLSDGPAEPHSWAAGELRDKSSGSPLLYCTHVCRNTVRITVHMIDMYKRRRIYAQYGTENPETGADTGHSTVQLWCSALCTSTVRATPTRDDRTRLRPQHRSHPPPTPSLIPPPPLQEVCHIIQPHISSWELVGIETRPRQSQA